MIQDEDCRAIIIDNGCDTIKAGFAKDQWPSTTFPCVVGNYKLKKGMVGTPGKDLVGDELRGKMAYLDQRNPIEHGQVRNWDDMEKIWHHTFYNKLCVAPEEHPVLLTESPLTPKVNIEKSTQIMFETFNTPALYHSVTALLALYASGRTTGIVLESGHTLTYTVPISQGYVIPYAILRLDLAGCDLTNYFSKRLAECGYPLDSFIHPNPNIDTVRDIKEKLAYIPLDYQHQPQAVEKSSSAKHYQLPDGRNISVGRELLQCPEALFQPSYLHAREEELQIPSPNGVHHCLNTSILKCEGNIQKHMYANIVLSGGNTLFLGMKERVEREVSSLALPTANVRVLAPVERGLLSWIGGANLASLSYFNRVWTSKDEYDESGPSIVHRRSF